MMPTRIVFRFENWNLLRLDSTDFYVISFKKVDTFVSTSFTEIRSSSNGTPAFLQKDFASLLDDLPPLD